MKMKSVSIPEDLHTWLYKNITTERKSLYAVIEWLRDCKEHSDRMDEGHLEEYIGITTGIALFEFVGDKPKMNYYVEMVGNTGKVRTAHDMSKAIGYRVFDPISRVTDKVMISFDVAASLRNRKENDKMGDDQ